MLDIYRLKEQLSIFGLNGGYILLYCLVLSYCRDPLLGFYMWLKLHAAHYYETFHYLYPRHFRYKHMIRLTDTGFFANLLFYYHPEYLPVCFNVQFLITLGYWTAVLMYGMKDTDNRKHDKIIPIFQKIHSILGHSVSLGILCYYQMIYGFVFDKKTLMYSFLWIYSWLFCIYVPWRYFTGDVVYSMLDHNKDFTKAVSTLITCNAIIFLAHLTGNAIYEIREVIMVFSGFP